MRSQSRRVVDSVEQMTKGLYRILLILYIILSGTILCRSDDKFHGSQRRSRGLRQKEIGYTNTHRRGLQTSGDDDKWASGSNNGAGLESPDRIGHVQLSNQIQMNQDLREANHNRNLSQLWTIELSLPWMIVIGIGITLSLILNIILMWYINCPTSIKETTN